MFLNLSFYLLIDFWPDRTAYGISFPTRDQPMPSVLEAQSLNHWTAREVPIIYDCYPHLLMTKLRLTEIK